MFFFPDARMSVVLVPRPHLPQCVARRCRGVICMTTEDLDEQFSIFCSNYSAVPIFVIGGICLLAVCLAYSRPVWKLCLCGCRCPCGHRSRGSFLWICLNLLWYGWFRWTLVSSSDIHQAGTDNPPTAMNNTDLPAYETISKAISTKDITPPPYTFVAAHPSDFGLEARVPSAPPQYRSRDHSAASVRSPVPVDSWCCHVLLVRSVSLIENIRLW